MTVSPLWRLSWVAVQLVRFLGVELLLTLPSSHCLPVPPDGHWLRGGGCAVSRRMVEVWFPQVCPLSRLLYVLPFCCLVLSCLFLRCGLLFLFALFLLCLACLCSCKWGGCCRRGWVCMLRHVSSLLLNCFVAVRCDPVQSIRLSLALSCSSLVPSSCFSVLCFCRFCDCWCVMHARARRLRAYPLPFGLSW